MDFLIGHVVGPYLLQERLGAGGMGVVYRAVHQGLDTPRAVKILAMNLATDETVVARFQREARLAVRLRHPNIVQVHDIGEARGLHYIAMELLEGRSLRDLIAHERPVPIAQSLALLRQLAAALDFAHASGVAHRDVKPANAFVGHTDHLTLVDFGIARAAEESRLTGTGMLVGTPEYMAPEQAMGGSSGHATDLYALGVVAFELLTGQVPFSGPNSFAVLQQQAQATPPSPRTIRTDLPEGISAAVLQQLAKQPNARFASGQAFVNALTHATGSTPTGIFLPPPAPPTADRPFVQPWTPPSPIGPVRGWTPLPGQGNLPSFTPPPSDLVHPPTSVMPPEASMAPPGSAGRDATPGSDPPRHQTPPLVQPVPRTAPVSGTPMPSEPVGGSVPPSVNDGRRSTGQSPSPAPTLRPARSALKIGVLYSIPLVLIDFLVEGIRHQFIDSSNRFFPGADLNLYRSWVNLTYIAQLALILVLGLHVVWTRRRARPALLAALVACMIVVVETELLVLFKDGIGAALSPTRVMNIVRPSVVWPFVIVVPTVILTRWYIHRSHLWLPIYLAGMVAIVVLLLYLGVTAMW